jgi:hypothetical protein
MSKTLLDSLLEKTQKNPERYADEYYTCFLNATLHFLSWDVVDEEKEYIAEKGKSLNPVIIDGENDEDIILIFDTKERVYEYAKGRDDLGIISMKGYDILNIFQEAYLILNPKSSYEKEFTPEEMKDLLANATQE